MRISDWSSDVCSSDLQSRDRNCTRPSRLPTDATGCDQHQASGMPTPNSSPPLAHPPGRCRSCRAPGIRDMSLELLAIVGDMREGNRDAAIRSEEHTSELQSLMRISYAVFCLKKKKTQ